MLRKSIGSVCLLVILAVAPPAVADEAKPILLAALLPETEEAARRAVAFLKACFAAPAAAAATPAFRPLEGSTDEPFPDGSVGRISEFRGADGTFLPAFVRKPKGDGPFPAVVMLHGGATSKGATYGFRKQTPAPAFIEAGWAIVSIDY